MSLIASIIESLLRKSPNSIIQLELLNSSNSIGNMSYSLCGTYSYNSVVELGNRINPNFQMHFGYIGKKKPVAIIGVPSKKSVESFLDVWEYGSSQPLKPIKFNNFNENQAKSISNYTVFGDLGIDSIKKVVTFDKISINHDIRMKMKNSNCPKIIDMDYKFSGSYSFDSIQRLIKCTDFCNTPFVIYGKVERIYVAIIGIRDVDVKNISGFRDVWEFGCKEAPQSKNFEYISYREAQKHKDFTVYGYCYFLGKNSGYPIQKIDRSLDPRFNFHVGDKDYRLR